LNRSQLVKAVSAHTGQDSRTVDATLKGVTDVIMGVASTGEPVRIKASKRARITALKGFKDALLNPTQAPKLARGVWPPAPPAAPAKKAAPARKAAPAKKAVAKKAVAKKR
jgi:nucleoid DNA-binding protein